MLPLTYKHEDDCKLLTLKTEEKKQIEKQLFSGFSMFSWETIEKVSKWKGTNFEGEDIWSNGCLTYVGTTDDIKVEIDAIDCSIAITFLLVNKDAKIHSEITPNMIYCYSWSEVISQMQKFISNLVKTADTFKPLQ